MNDALAPRFGDGGIRWSLLGATVVGAASALFFWQCGRTLREDLARGQDGAGRGRGLTSQIT
jgi:hypothetical protein